MSETPRADSADGKQEGRPCGPGWRGFPSPGKIYGTATIGERGQISIPADARKDLGLKSGDKVVVFGNRVNGSISLMKADLFENFADFFMTKLNKLGEHAQSFFDMLTQPADAEPDEEPEAN
ncbi:MAG: AbrB/MazE/SpoVT family DNA-binding domain-containing protein [Propionibacteriaceae bacterium]|jgi:AbrB family looped-hinge helix DNA binding protein|nr:AbrB/MazE/SpoVT family DNA-binding domain-containing protein [Propionibacteriaceae bacterium]